MIDVKFVIPLILLILQAVAIANMDYVDDMLTRDWQDIKKSTLKLREDITDLKCRLEDE